MDKLDALLKQYTENKIGANVMTAWGDSSYNADQLAAIKQAIIKECQAKDLLVQLFENRLKHHSARITPH